MLGARDTRLGGTCMKHELEQVHIESYGLTGPEVVVAAAIKVYLMNLPWSDAKKKMDAVISLERGAVTVDGRTLSGLVNDSVEYALGAVGQKTELAPELWQTMEAQLKSVNGSVTVQTKGRPWLHTACIDHRSTLWKRRCSGGLCGQFLFIRRGCKGWRVILSRYE